MTEDQSQSHQVVLGADVHSNDGVHIGKVDQLIIHADSGRVDGFLLEHGHFNGPPKIVSTDAVASVGPNGVILNISVDQSRELPNVIHEQLVKSSDSMTYGFSGGGLVSAGGASGQWVIQGASGGQLPHSGGGSLFAQPQIGTVVTENITNIPSDSILISEGTDVIGSDGKKIGTVHSVTVDSELGVTGIEVKSGWLIKRIFTVPRSDIASATTKDVRLTRPS